MASLQKTYSGDLTQSILMQLWAARGMAADAKANAMDVANAYGVDPMLRGGEFFSRALQTRATAGLPRRFQRQMPSVTMGDPSYITRGQATPFSSGINPKPTNAQIMNRLAGQPFPWLAVGSSLKNQNQKPATTQALNKAANKPITNTSTRTQGVKVTDEKLGSFIAAVALSLTSSIDSHKTDLMDFIDSSTQQKMNIIESTQYNQDTEVTHISWEFQNKLNQIEFMYNFEMRMFFPDTLNRLLIDSKFNIDHFYGNYQFEKFNEDSEKQIYLCSK